MASTFNFPTSKRSACDRCRKQKLRCPSRASDAQPCARCVRAGLECITGYTRPLGRSHRIPYTSVHKQNLSQSHAFSVVGQQQIDLSTAPEDSPTSPSVAKHAHKGPEQTSLSDPLTVVASSSAFFTEIGGGIDSLVCPAMMDSVSGEPLLAGTYQVHCDYDTINVDNNSDSLSLSPQYIEADEVTYSSESTPGNSTPSTLATANASSRTLSRIDSDLRLSHLSMDLCRQSQRNMAVDQDLTELETTHKPLNGCLDTSDQGKEFGDALCSTSEFLAIVQSKLDDMTLNDPTTRRETHWHLMDLSCILNLISCYLLIVSVFEKLVLQLYNKMTRNGNETSSSHSSKTPHSAGPQEFPGLHLGSFRKHHTSPVTYPRPSCFGIS